MRKPKNDDAAGAVDRTPDGNPQALHALRSACAAAVSAAGSQIDDALRPPCPRIDNEQSPSAARQLHPNDDPVAVDFEVAHRRALRQIDRAGEGRSVVRSVDDESRHDQHHGHGDDQTAHAEYENFDSVHRTGLCCAMKDEHASGEVVEAIVPPDAAGQRVDRLLAALLADRSRSSLKRLIEDGCLTSGGETIAEPSHRVKPGEALTLRIPPAADPAPAGERIPLAIVFEDEHLIVIEKPAGLVVHPAPGNARGTLVNALIAHCGDGLKGIGGVRRPGIVHRLDKDTSGLMVAAKTGPAHESLTAQFSQRAIERRYAAFVWGTPCPPEGEIEGNIGRSDRDRKKMAVLPARGRPALTRYRTVAVFDDGAVSRLECRLATGRTHQIRVHLAHSGHPVVGDSVYGGGATRARRSALQSEALAAALGLERQALHATRLGFVHPATGEKLAFESGLAAEIRKFEETLTGNFPRR